MKKNFEKAFEFVLKWEGGKSKHPSDPGGLTIYGISSKYHPKEVKEMDKLWNAGKFDECKAIAKKIYKSKYWDPIKGDELAEPFDIILFDTAVNMGVSKALELAKYNNAYELLLERIRYYNNLALRNQSLRTFLCGWINRVLSLKDFISEVSLSEPKRVQDSSKPAK